MGYISLIEKLKRKKYVDFDTALLPRVLSLLDLTALGIGSTVGVGFYVLAGQVARDTAGPAVVICFLIAALASVFAGICYAEFGARVPKAGSAYVYTYVCIGEFVAFVIGWNLVLEYVIGTASVARGYSGYVDYLAHDKMKTAFNNTMHMDVPFLSPYPDFFAFGMILVVSALLCIGVKESTYANNVFTAVNMFVITYVIIAGATVADPDNWKLSYDQVHNDSFCDPPNESQDPVDPWGKGGFAPYGFNGIMQGAATCFFGFVGFDVIATTGEEAKRPERNIPLSICLSLFFVFLAYFGMSTVITLAIPYCMEDPNAPLIDLFEFYGMNVSKWIVSVGALFGFAASLLGVIFPMPRIIYAMAYDGLIFRFLARISKRFETPLIATVVTAVLSGIMALLFTLDDLVDMMSIGTLMAYTIVAICVMLLRFTETSVGRFNDEYTLLKYVPTMDDSDSVAMDINGFQYKSGHMIKDNQSTFSFKEYKGQLFNRAGIEDPTELTSALVNYATLCFCVVCFLLALCLTLFQTNLANGDPGIIVLVVVIFILVIFNLIIIARQPMSKKKLTFKVPLVPWIPAFSAFFNLYLMCNLTVATWIRFVVWMVIGLFIYFLYGIRNSSGNDVPTLPLNYGDHNINPKELIPSIIILPPTPMLTSQMSTVKPEPERRTSIIDSTAVSGNWVVMERTQTQPSIEKGDTMINEPDTTTQFVSTSPLPETNEESLIESESQNSGQGSEVSYSSITVLVASVPATVANVDAVNDANSIHDVTEAEVSVVIKSSVNSKAVSSESESFETPVTSASHNFSEDIETVPTEIAVSVFEHRDIEDNGRDDEKNNISGFKTIENSVDNTQNEDVTNAVNSDHPCQSVSLSDPKISTAVSTVTVNAVSSSVPVTPAIPRHPYKLLKKSSSFDDIPPSSPDSPLATRVNKFIIIPVIVSQDEGDCYESAASSVLNNSTQASLQAEREEKQEEIKSNLLTELNSQLAKLHVNNKRAVPGEQFYTNQTISLGTELDTIRERGESKASSIGDINSTRSRSSSKPEDDIS